MTPPVTDSTPTVATRRLAAVVAFALLSALLPLGSASAAQEVPLRELRARRAELVRKLATVTDRSAEATNQLAELGRRRSALEGELEAARRAIARHAVDTYVDLADVEPFDRLRAVQWSQAGVHADQALVDRVRRAGAAILGARIDAEAALAEARTTQAELTKLRDELERTIAERERAAAPTGGSPRRGLPTGVRLTTQRQAELMARYPFGPVSGVPAGLVPTGTVVAGPASWYGPGFDGRPTASGAIFDQEGWTVASRTLPLGTILLIHHGDRSVLALVNDRGPFVKGRVLDLSKGVARALGTIEKGVANVRAEVLVPQD